MPFQILFPWGSPTKNVRRTMRRQSKQVRDAVTKQWWYVELDSCGKNKTAIRLCLVPLDDFAMNVIMKFNLYLKKDNIVLAVASNTSRFSRFKRISQVCLMPIQFKDIKDNVKLSMTFDNPIYMALDSSTSFLNQAHFPILERNRCLENRVPPLVIGRNNTSFLSFLKIGEFSDIIITVDGEEIKCHKLVLCWNSPYFYGMFKSNLKESIENKIDIVDFDYETINAMINYLYTSFMPRISLELAKKLHIAADKYQILGLKHICEQQLILEITTQTSVDILLHADIYSAEKVKNHTMKFILSNWKDFKDKEHYEALMTRPDLLQDLIAKANEDSESDVKMYQTNSESVSPLLTE